MVFSVIVMKGWLVNSWISPFVTIFALLVSNFGIIITAHTEYENGFLCVNFYVEKIKKTKFCDVEFFTNMMKYSSLFLKNFFWMFPLHTFQICCSAKNTFLVRVCIFFYSKKKKEKKKESCFTFLFSCFESKK